LRKIEFDNARVDSEAFFSRAAAGTAVLNQWPLHRRVQFVPIGRNCQTFQTTVCLTA